MRLTLSVRSADVAEIAGPAGTARVQAGALVALRKALSVVERHHKHKEWIRGSKALRAAGGKLKVMDTDPDKLTVRSAILIRSYSGKLEPRELAAYYGSDVTYSRVHEFGLPSRGLRARPGLQRTVAATGDQIEKIMADSIKEKLDE
jgi:hypothetical protein